MGAAEMGDLLQITESVGATPAGDRAQSNAGSACVLHLRSACSVRPRRSDLGVEVRSWLRPGIVTARDPSADRRDGFTAVFGGRPHVCHQRFAQNHRSSVHHQLTSSSKPGSTPARTIAAACSACLALWCWASYGPLYDAQARQGTPS
jgi:hypothetical protein